MNQYAPHLLYFAENFSSPYCPNAKGDCMPDVPADERSEFWA